MLHVADARERHEPTGVAGFGGALGIARGRSRSEPRRRLRRERAAAVRRAEAARSATRRRSAWAPCRAVPRAGCGRRRETAAAEPPRAGPRRRPGRRRRQPGRAARHRANPAGSPRRAAAQKARWPPAECPTATTRARSSGSSSAPSRSMPAATSSKVWGQPPRLRQPSRRYSRFQTAQPRPARSPTSASSRRRLYLARQNPPWMRTATGHGAAPSEGRVNSPSWSR